MHRSSLLLARYILIGLLFGVPTLSHAATFYLNYSELLPGTTQYQSQYNGWNTPSSYSVKDIITPEYISAYNNSTTPSGCRRITTTSVVGRYFIPTRTLAEWDSFRTFTPPGITINYCPVDARCSTTANTCLAGTPSGFSAPTCGGTATWTCNGLYGGSSVSCSTPNTPCPSCGAGVNTCNNGSPENMNGGSCGGYSTWSCRGGRLNTDTVSCNRYNAACYWTTGAWGSCSASCGGGWQYRSVACYDPRGYTVSNWNCSGAMPSTSQQCNTQPCCVPTTWSPQPTNVCIGQQFTQTSNCGTTRIAYGTSLGNYWSPSPSLYCQGQTFTQTSECGQTRIAYGTKPPSVVSAWNGSAAAAGGVRTYDSGNLGVVGPITFSVWTEDLNYSIQCYNGGWQTYTAQNAGWPNAVDEPSDINYFNGSCTGNRIVLQVREGGSYPTNSMGYSVTALQGCQ